jgi:hypothetical protein
MSSTLPLSRNWGSSKDLDNPLLFNELDDMYFDIANALSLLVKKNIVNGADPSASDQRNSLFSIGDISVRKDTNTAWIMTSRTTPNDVTWTLIS